MSGCENYQIRPLERFNSSYIRLIKNHYRRNARARNSFEKLIESYIEELRKNPSSNQISNDESFPKGCSNQVFQFRKIRFKAPELQGAARYGRLMYVVYEPRCVVYLVWVYTHEEFGTKNCQRPLDSDLRQEFTAIQEDIEQSANTENI